MISPDPFKDCSALEQQMNKLDERIMSGGADALAVQRDLEGIGMRLNVLAAAALQLREAQKDTRNLSGRVERIEQNLAQLRGLAEAMLVPPKEPVKEPAPTRPPSGRQGRKAVSFDRIPKILHPKAGPKAQGGKEVQKVDLYKRWLTSEYSNKKSPTYKAYQALAKSEGLDKALFVGIRGDGDCGFRAMAASLLLELACDANCGEKIPVFVERLTVLEQEFSTALPGYDRLDRRCLEHLRENSENPEQLVALLNDDRFLGDLTRVFRFLSNAICAKDFQKLPEEVRIQLEYGEGAQTVGSAQGFLQAHATVDVGRERNLAPYLFAGVAQIRVLAERLGVDYWMGIVDEGSAKPQSPNTFSQENPLVKLHLMCRDTRHFDVVLKKST